jgi:hypothetical protein
MPEICDMETEIVREEIEEICEEVGEEYEVLSRSTIRVTELVMCIGDGLDVRIQFEEIGDCLYEGEVDNACVFLRGYLARESNYFSLSE